MNEGGAKRVYRGGTQKIKNERMGNENGRQGKKCIEEMQKCEANRQGND
jgi:hypothetical protein